MQPGSAAQPKTVTLGNHTLDKRSVRQIGLPTAPKVEKERCPGRITDPAFTRTEGGRSSSLIDTSPWAEQVADAQRHRVKRRETRVGGNIQFTPGKTEQMV